MTDDQTLNDLKPVLASATKRTQSHIDAIIDTFEIDWSTGRSNVTNTEAFVSTFQKQNKNQIVAQELARSLLATLLDGFAVGQNEIAPDEPAFRPIPWRSLFHEASLSSMTLKDWEWLGIHGKSTPSQISESVSRFKHYPEYMLNPAHLDALAGSAAFYLPLLHTPIEWPARPSDFTGGRPWFRDTVPVERIGVRRQALGGEPQKPESPPPAGPDYAQIARDFLNFVKEIADCLASAQWSVQWAAFYPLGVRICLDPACAQKVANALKALLGTSAGNVAATIATLAAKGLLSWAALLSALGWVGLAMLHFASYWAAMILLNMTSRGVCIVHLFPWNSALSGGAFNGWAEGR
jgi:hypothetical protein